MSESAPTAPERVTPQIAYGSMAGIITSESEKFLQAFLSGAKGLDQSSALDSFLLRFALMADRFSAACCDRFSAFLREASIHSEVRGTSESVLSRLIRNRCFEEMDGVFADYLSLVRQANIDLAQTVRQLSESRVRDTMAQVAQGVPGSGAEQRNLLAPQSARASALIRIVDYLGALNSLPRDFLDYGSSKLFGGDVDFAMQERFLRTIADSIHEKLSGATAIMDSLELVKQKKWDQQRAAESAAIKAVATIAGQAQVKRRSGVSSFVIALISAAPIYFFFNLGIFNRYVIGLSAVFGVTAVFFFFRGVIHLTKG